MSKKDESAQQGIIEGYRDDVRVPSCNKWDSTNIENWTWDKQPLGGIIPTSGNAMDNLTGGWRTEKPIWDKEKCTNCLICWIDCPDSAICVKDGNWDRFDYDHCKGCGVCAKVCPADAIHMENERGEA